jgi:hypothetical protein
MRQSKSSKEADLIHPNTKCDHSTAEWETCLEQDCGVNPERDELYGKLLEHYQEDAHAAIIEHMVEPVGSYFGTSSCWMNAALAGVRTMADTIVATDEMLVRKDRDITVIKHGEYFFLVTDEVPDGDRLISFSLDGEDDLYFSYLGIIRHDDTGWYRNVIKCEGWDKGWTERCLDTGYETMCDHIGTNEFDVLYLCGSCQARFEIDR